MARAAIIFCLGSMTSGLAAPQCPPDDTLARRIEAQWPMRERLDPVSLYIVDLGQRLANEAQETRHWKFHVVRDKKASAFATPSADLYISEGVLLLAQDEEEVMAAIAHEMGHVLLGHFCEHRQGGWWRWLSWTWEKGNGLPRKNSERRVPAMGNLAQEVDPQKEKEADSLAASLLWRAGANPGALARLLGRILPPEDPRLSALAGLPSRRQAPPPSKKFMEIKKILEKE